MSQLQTKCGTCPFTVLLPDLHVGELCGDLDVFPHVFVWGSCFWFCIPSAFPSLASSSAPPPSFCHAQLCHTQSLRHTQPFIIFHTQLCHTQLRHTHLCHHNFVIHVQSFAQFGHAQLCHTQPFTHTNFVTHSFFTRNFFTHNLSHTTLSRTVW